MGKGPKHNNGKSRNNGIFRVAGQKFKNEKKGKAKEDTSKVKLVRNYIIIIFGSYKASFFRFLGKIRRL